MNPRMGRRPERGLIIEAIGRDAAIRRRAISIQEEIHHLLEVNDAVSGVWIEAERAGFVGDDLLPARARRGLVRPDRPIHIGRDIPGERKGHDRLQTRGAICIDPGLQERARRLRISNAGIAPEIGVAVVDVIRACVRGIIFPVESGQPISAVTMNGAADEERVVHAINFIGNRMSGRDRIDRKSHILRSDAGCEREQRNERKADRITHEKHRCLRSLFRAAERERM